MNILLRNKYYLIGIAAAAVIPVFLSGYYHHLLITILLWAYLGSCWNILGGYAGQFSFGHAAFFGIGAYSSSLLYVDFGISPWIGMLIGGLIAAGFGLFVGYLCFRYGLRGAYFALSMLACAGMLHTIAANWKFVKGAMGILIPLGNSIGQFSFHDRLPFYYIILIMTICVLVITRLIQNSKSGYYFIAIREDEDSAEALGVDAKKYKLLAMAISAFGTALGGSFYAQYYTYIDPELAFGSHISIDILLRPIVGGIGTLWGPTVGSIVLSPLSEISRSLFRDYSGLHLMIFGSILIAVTILLPRGILGLVQDTHKFILARLKKG